MRKRVCHNEHPMHPTYALATRYRHLVPEKRNNLRIVMIFCLFFLKNERETTPQYERMELRF